MRPTTIFVSYDKVALQCFKHFMDINKSLTRITYHKVIGAIAQPDNEYGFIVDYITGAALFLYKEHNEECWVVTYRCNRDSTLAFYHCLITARAKCKNVLVPSAEGLITTLTRADYKLQSVQEMNELIATSHDDDIMKTLYNDFHPLLIVVVDKPPKRIVSMKRKK